MRKCTDAKKASSSNACTVCKRRKLKCDGKKPCSRCIHLNIAEECIYIVDRRKDRRQCKSGSKEFVFQNHVFNEVHGSSEKKDKRRTANRILIASKPEAVENQAIDILSFARDGDQFTSEKTWNNPLEMSFEFDDFTFEGADVDNFLKLLGDVMPPFQREDFCDPNINYSDRQKVLPIAGNESMDCIQQRYQLINIIFENESHTPPGVSKRHLIDLVGNYRDLEMAEGDHNEKFLLSTVLCLGALTLRKRELLKHKPSEESPSTFVNGIPKVAVDAYRYYNIAKGLIPNILLIPSIDGFCGLVLMANFMTLMISLEGQLYLSVNALKVAAALGWHKKKVSQELIASNHNGIGLILLFWNVWCSSCMLATFLGQQPSFNFEEINTVLPCEMPLGDYSSDFSLRFMQLRVQLADIQSRVFRQLHMCGTIKRSEFMELEKELDTITIRVSQMKSLPIFEERLFYRSSLLMLELSSLRAQTCFLLYRHHLLDKRSLQAVNTAKSIIREIWSHYTKQSTKNKKDVTHHLDWNFCYPLRTASLTLWISCVILLKYSKSVPFLKDYDTFEYSLALEVLQDLVQLLPIEEDLVGLIINKKDSIVDTIGCSSRVRSNFWTCMLS